MRSRRATLALAGSLLAACSSSAIDDAPGAGFAERLIAREDSSRPRTATIIVDTSNAASDTALVLAPLPAKTIDDEWRGLLDLPSPRRETLLGVASDDAALTRFLEARLSVEDLAALSVLRSPAVRTARARYEAARTAYAQSQDLGDLVGLFRSFARDTVTRVGPERSRRSTGMIAPAPNVSGLSAEVARRTADMAFESLRAAVRDIVARAWRAHADAARLHESRKILREDVELDQVLLKVLESRLEAGTGSQAGLLAFQARLERLKTELEILDRQATVVAAEWNQLLSRPEASQVAIDVDPDLPIQPPAREAEPHLVELGQVERQELRAARLAAERADLGLRLAETMTLPRMDIGSSRFERERAGEAGVQRGAVFPEPGRMVMPRWEFGVREAQVQEMRSRAESLAEARDSLRDRVATETRRALFDVDSASRRVDVHEKEVVPLARNSLEAARGAYEGSRSGYLDLLDAVRRLLDARLGLADARRALVHSQASLLRAVGVEGR